MVQFTVVGSLNYDLVSYTERVPRAGETFKGDAFETHIGGKGLNQTIALARMVQGEDKVRMIGSVGDDAFGEELKSSLARNGVDVSNVKELKGVPSGVAVIIVEKINGENRILITPGANGYTKYTDDQLDQLFETDQEVAVFQNEVPGTQFTIEWLHKYRPQITVVYNPSPYYKFSADIIDLVDILIVNEGESMSIAKDMLSTEEYQNFESLIDNDVISGYEKLADTLQTRLNIQKIQTVVITLGYLGTIYKSKDKSGYIEATKVEKVVDTTGAGDTFLGAFLTQLFENEEVGKAVKFASNASSLAIQKNGASDSIPTYNDVIKL